ncbi:hypothetical protein MC885_012623 [Smutsia gigantea]|nr:hypothetical protein MC885_012623 [Smutsia gigantea]
MASSWVQGGGEGVLSALGAALPARDGGVTQPGSCDVQLGLEWDLGRGEPASPPQASLFPGFASEEPWGLIELPRGSAVEPPFRAQADQAPLPPQSDHGPETRLLLCPRCSCPPGSQVLATQVPVHPPSRLPLCPALLSLTHQGALCLHSGSSRPDGWWMEGGQVAWGWEPVQGSGDGSPLHVQEFRTVLPTRTPETR